MPENTTARDIEELGTTLYDRAREVREIAELLWNSAKTFADAEMDIYREISHGADVIESAALTLNPNAAADSVERNGEPLEVADCSHGLKYAQFKDVDGLTGMIEDGSNGTLWMGMSHRKLHLSRQQVAALLPHLKRFVETGRL
jgi:hypothetical protein